eukprot:m.382256 g.382256  ORF g.382256 m.382256 type:complete len:193 (+) comp28257_c0_seq1:137-715(+)
MSERNGHKMADLEVQLKTEHPLVLILSSHSHHWRWKKEHSLVLALSSHSHHLSCRAEVRRLPRLSAHHKRSPTISGQYSQQPTPSSLSDREAERPGVQAEAQRFQRARRTRPARDLGLSITANKGHIGHLNTRTLQNLELEELDGKIARGLCGTIRGVHDTGTTTQLASSKTIHTRRRIGDFDAKSTHVVGL